MITILFFFISIGNKFIKYGHLTQLIWAETDKLGCGITLLVRNMFGGSMWKYLLVCEYGPAGNVESRPIYQYGKSCSRCPVDTNCRNNLCSEGKLKIFLSFIEDST